jgi:hypothetical protein
VSQCRSWPLRPQAAPADLGRCRYGRRRWMMVLGSGVRASSLALAPGSTIASSVAPRIRKRPDRWGRCSAGSSGFKNNAAAVPRRGPETRRGRPALTAHLLDHLAGIIDIDAVFPTIARIKCEYRTRLPEVRAHVLESRHPRRSRSRKIGHPVSSTHITSPSRTASGHAQALGERCRQRVEVRQAIAVVR